MISGSKDLSQNGSAESNKRLSDAVVSDTTVENTDGFYFSSSSIDARYVLQQVIFNLFYY